MSLKLKDPERIPYGGIYKLDWPEGGMVGFGTGFNMLLDNIRRYRKANGIPIGLGFDDEVEAQVCLRYPRECHHAMPDTVPKAVKFGWLDVVAGTKAIIQHKILGMLESQEEADRRAAICAKCPMKTEVHLQCAGLCGELQAVVNSLVGARETSSHSAIDKKCCAVCRCYLTAVPFVPLDIQTSVLSEEQKQQFRDVAASGYPCWKAVNL